MAKRIDIGRFTLLLDWRIILLALVFIFVFCRLGFWQLSRAAQKRELQSALEQRLAVAPRALAELNVDSLQPYLPVTISGSLIEQKNILLVRQFYRGQLGVEVISPIRLASDNRLLLVSRGWSSIDKVPQIPAVSGQQTLSGTVYIDPGPTFFQQAAIAETVWPLELRQLDIELAASYYNEPLLPYIVRLYPDSPGALQAHWPRPTVAAGNHRSYALQWFGMAALVLTGVLIYSLRRKPC